MVEYGFITKIYRHMSSCIYQIAFVFKQPYITFRLRHLLPGLKLSLLTAISFTSAGEQNNQKFTQLKVNLNPSVLVTNLLGGYPQLDSQPTKRIVKPLRYQLQNGWNEEFKKRVRGEIVMSEHETISPAIMAIKSISLTLAGQIEFMPYPDEAIIWADYTMSQIYRPIDNVFAYFRSLLNSYCGRHKIAPDWQLSQKLKEYHCIPVTAPKIKNNIIHREAVPTIPQEVLHPIPPKKFLKQESIRPVVQWKPTEFKRVKIPLPEQTPEQKIKARIFSEKLQIMLGLDPKDDPQYREIGYTEDPESKKNFEVKNLDGFLTMNIFKKF